MMKNEFWKKVADAWSKKETIEVPLLEEEMDMPEELGDEEWDEEIPFEDWDDDDMDEFFGDILNGE